MTDAQRHILNPLHIMCRLTEFGISVKRAMKIVRWYEIHIYKRIFKED
jgi:hypothetical protein